MINPIQVSFRGMASSKAIASKIHQRADRLDRFHPDIVSCRVMFEQLHHRHLHGNLFHVRVDVGVPGGELVVGHERHDHRQYADPWVAVRDAFDRMDRQLEDFARKQGNRAKSHVVPQHGTVTRVSPDHGFIQTADGREIYFHRNSVVGEGFEGLEDGASVRFDLYEGEGVEGPQASTVRPIGKHHLPDVEVT